MALAGEAGGLRKSGRQVVNKKTLQQVPTHTTKKKGGLALPSIREQVGFKCSTDKLRQSGTGGQGHHE